MKKHTKRFGLTGSIGSGKSTVAWLFNEFGVPTIDSDAIAHEALAPKSQIWHALFERFGSEILGVDGAIDRAALGRIVFRDPKERRFLESLLHPHVRDAIGHRIATLASGGAPFVVVEVPLLYEAGWEHDFDAVIVVSCDEAQAIERCQRHLGLDREEAIRRLQAQWPLARKAQAADAIIDTRGSIEETKVEVARLHQAMVKGTFPKG